ncbi:hypothetical protein ATY78_06085 [Rhizobium sp. R635]|uniref:MafI family immunity protein n=1 Tax=Rhizobium sp. R635 TaxID=1764275 RepID=UPI000B52F958|nr:MafI family immunity protein [Rhizobium sp. R635]OWV84272.1 hypothetical protein ATY78_06085 [Rhizobium sp. R635]
MEIEKRLIKFISDFNERLGGEYIREYISLVEHNECVVALENLCVQLYECDVVSNPEELIAIQDLAREMNLEENAWNFIR